MSTTLTPSYSAVRTARKVSSQRQGRDVTTADLAGCFSKCRVSRSARSELLRRCSDHLLVKRLDYSDRKLRHECDWVVRYATTVAWASPGCRPC